MRVRSVVVAEPLSSSQSSTRTSDSTAACLAVCFVAKSSAVNPRLRKWETALERVSVFKRTPRTSDQRIARAAFCEPLFSRDSMRTLLSVTLITLAACAHDPATFRPAKDARARESVRDAYRVYQPDSACEKIGVVVDAHDVAAIAKTAANHGATHYVVTNEERDTHYETSGGGYAAPGPGGGTFISSSSTTRAVTERNLVAHAYVCP